MNNRIEDESSIIGVYGRSDGSSSILTFNGSESRESIYETKPGNVLQLLSSLIFMIIFVFKILIRLFFVLNHF